MKLKRQLEPDPRGDFRGLSSGYLDRLATEGWVAAAVGVIVGVHAAAGVWWLWPNGWAIPLAAVAAIGARLGWAGTRQAVLAGEERERRMPCDR